MKRASYREACEWIAANDNAGNGDDEEAVAGYVSTLLVADLFGVEPGRVGRDVMRRRKRQEREE
jgi:hypothetical protein